ncbi:High-affinity hexose transporter HXT6 [Wickerhamomyces ciferrii]|uniref:High-affinity hexose transporter HXT6 n=1 Tax=Wickerhamomyces ciferrii (strain ATCC 14091 / BCRC 22168 / CBS 111 / JCM 3599 / NBRC 0793 / NRRL Y-1031 F-60-10) TaxID=1206466 RepID=K0KGH8_WICCF|nr:High-affinity hexose transporter HXT6 [Wickerhamomyces ciferrii]CCH41272.1 High-affinity hexose transporter HXT6 [Wickerhamomyces ciferrii]
MSTETSGQQTPVDVLSDDHEKIENSSLEGNENQHHAGIPEKPVKEYVFISILCLMVAFGGFVFGWDTGTIGGFVNHTDFIRRFGQMNSEGDYFLSKVRVGLIVSIFNIGCAFGGILLAPLGDRLGRRIGLMVVMVVYIVGILIQITSTTKWFQYFIGRIISGLGVGAIAVLSPMLISETAPKALRGTLVSCYQLMITFGIFLGYCTNFGTKTYSNSAQWRIPLGLCFFWALLMIFGMTLMPESPRYLIEVGRIEEAQVSIAKSNKISVDDPSVFGEVEIIQAGIDKEKAAGTASWGELFTGKPRILYRVIMGIMLQSLQQLTGDNYFFYYGTTIFNAVGMKDSFQTAIVLGIVNFVSTFAGLYAVERFGRRKSLLGGAAGMIACFAVFASVGVTKLYLNPEHTESSKGAGNAMIVFACIYIFFFASTWGPIIFVVISETYPIRIKSKAMGLATAANWLWGFLIGFFTPFITSAINFYYGYVFLGCLVFAFLYVFFFVAETKGLTLEEVNEMYAEKVLPWKSSSWVPPAQRTAAQQAQQAEETTDDAPKFLKRFF